MNTRKFEVSDMDNPRLQAPSEVCHGKEIIKLRAAQRVYRSRLRFATIAASVAACVAICVAVFEAPIANEAGVVVEPPLASVTRIVDTVIVERVVVERVVERVVVEKPKPINQIVTQAQPQIILSAVQEKIHVEPVVEHEVSVTPIAPRENSVESSYEDKKEKHGSEKENDIFAVFRRDPEAVAERRARREQNKQELRARIDNIPQELAQAGRDFISMITKKDKQDENN